MAYLLIPWINCTIRQAVSNSENDQVKPVSIYKNENWIYSYTIIYSYIVNVNLMLMCTEWSEMWSFIVHMPENSLYLE